MRLKLVWATRAFVPAILLLAVLGTFCGPGFAQSEAQPGWTATTTTRIRPDMRQEFEACLMQLVATHKKAGTRWFLTLETFAGETSEYTTVEPVMKFADLDGPPAVERVLGKVGWKRLSRRMARCYTSQSRQYATPQESLEIENREAAEGIYWVETHLLIIPGKMVDYLNWLRTDYRPALAKAGVARLRVWHAIFGAEAGEIVTMRALKNLAEIDGGALLSRVMNDEQTAAMMAKSMALVSSSHTRILKTCSDLSYAAGR